MKVIQKSGKSSGKLSSKPSGKSDGKLIITHAMNFHADDVFAVATLVYKFEQDGYSLTAKDPSKKIKIIRTLEPQKYENTADFIVDIGAKYNPKKGWLDHHQKGGAGARPNGIMYASFGLVWKEFGKNLTGTKFAADWVDRHVVQGVDALDTGTYLYTPLFPDVHPFLFSEYIKTVCDTVKGDMEGGIEKNNGKNSKAGNDGKNGKISKKFDKEFMRLLPIAKDALRAHIIKSKQKEGITKMAGVAYNKAVDKRVIVSDKFIPTQFEEFKAPQYIEPLVFVYPDLRGGWSAKVVPMNSQSYDSRIKFPEEWYGKKDAELAKVSGVPDAVFCHNTGFLAVAKSKEGALELVRKAFEILKLPRYK